MVDIVIEVRGRAKVGKSTIAKEIQNALTHLGILATIFDDSSWVHEADDSERFNRLGALIARGPEIVIQSRGVSASKPKKRKRG